MKPQSSGRSQTGALNIHTKLTLFGIACAIFMGAIENTVAGTAMPTVIATFGGVELYSWVFTSYILAATIMTPIWGKMADLIGRRPAFLGGLALFILGSALSGASQSMGQLIAFRTVQGLGAAALFPVGMTIASDLLSLEQRAKMIGIFSSMWGVASLAGPVVGGYLTAYLSWRWVFYLSLPFGILAGIIVQTNYSEKYERRRGIRIDYTGTAILAVALIVLLVAVEQGAGQAAASVAVMFLGAALLGWLFIRVERRAADPLIPLELFGNRIVALATLHGLFMGMTLLGTMNYLPLFVQAVIGTDAIAAGKILMPYILPWVLTATLGARLILRFGYRPIVLAGMVSILAGAGMLAQVSETTSRLELSFFAGLMGIGGGLTMASLMMAAQHAVAGNQLGVTTSTVQFARSIGAALGTASMGAIMNWWLVRELARGGGEIARLSGHDIATIILPETRKLLSSDAAAYLQRALAGSLRWSFVFILASAVAGMLIALFIPAGSAHELAHSEHHPQQASSEAA